MAVLSDSDRQALWADFMRNFPAGESCGITKAELRAAVNGLDDYMNTNASAINQAIPQPARGTLTASQKARLLVWVIRKRYDVGG